MPVNVCDLELGDRVILNCPKARVARKREAVFEGIFASHTAAAAAGEPDEITLISEPSAEFLASGKAWARFLFRTLRGSTARADFIGAFIVEPDGGLREEEGRRVYVEQRLGRPAQG